MFLVYNVGEESRECATFHVLRRIYGKMWVDRERPEENMETGSGESNP